MSTQDCVTTKQGASGGAASIIDKFSFLAEKVTTTILPG